MTATQLPPTGELFVARYRLEAVLGEGGFARVYQARDVELERDVAIKVLRPSDDANFERAAARFLQEMKLVAAISHPNIVQMFDYGRTADQLMYMVLELVPGRDLSELCREGPVPEPVAVRIVTQLLEALRAAHEVGTLHRDIKPGNVRLFEYLGDPWCVKLLDFGIAKSRHDDAALTGTGMTVGTPQYMAPEQFFGEPVGPTTDLYSLALLTYRMVAGERLDHMRMISTGQPVNVAAAHLSEPLQRVLNRMLEREPSNRYASAAAVLQALNDRDRLEPAPSTERRTARRPDESTGRSGERPTRPLALVALVALAVAVVAVVGVLVKSRGQREAPSSSSPARRVPVALVRSDETKPESEKAAPAVQADELADAGNDAPNGCGEPPPFLGRGPMSTTHGLDQTRWLVHVPRNYEPTRRHPAVMLFHDDASSPEGILDDTSLDGTADQHGFVIIAPQDTDLAYVWDDPLDLDNARIALDVTSRRLCLDSARVFLVGHGTGGAAVDALACEDWVRGIALASWLTPTPEFRCTPTRAVPSLYFAPMKTGFQPPQGGRDCSGGHKISYDEYEAMWRHRNACSDSKRTTHREGDSHCRAWECGANPFVSCRVDGGRGWPGAPPRAFDVLDCDGEPPDFPYNELIWDFFSSLGPASSR